MAEDTRAHGATDQRLALAVTCPVCHAQAGQTCVAALASQRRPRTAHHARQLLAHRAEQTLSA